MTERVSVPVELVLFLLGEGALHGLSFGEKMDGKPYWWRKELRKAMLAAAPAEQRNRVTGALSKTVADQIIRAESAERQRDAAVAALKEYGDHGIFCGLVNNEAVCTCGYDKAIKEAK